MSFINVIQRLSVEQLKSSKKKKNGAILEDGEIKCLANFSACLKEKVKNDKFTRINLKTNEQLTSTKLKNYIPKSLCLKIKNEVKVFYLLSQKYWQAKRPAYRSEILDNMNTEFLVLWFDNKTKQWRISLNRFVETDMCYAYVRDDSKLPHHIKQIWKIYNNNTGRYNNSREILVKL